VVPPDSHIGLVYFYRECETGHQVLPRVRS
jgi:hypothetical protein